MNSLEIYPIDWFELSNSNNDNLYFIQAKNFVDGIEN